MIEKGYLDVRSGYGFVPFALNQGLEFAADNVMEGKPLGDWDTSFVVRLPLAVGGERFYRSATKPVQDVVSKHMGEPTPNQPSETLQQLFREVNLTHAFLLAHTKSRITFRREFCREPKMVTHSEKIVLNESELECRMANEFLETKNADDVKNVVAHIMCNVLLNKAVRYTEKLHRNGLLKASEATEWIEEFDHQLNEVSKCTAHKHPDEISQSEKDHRNNLIKKKE